MHKPAGRNLGGVSAPRLIPIYGMLSAIKPTFPNGLDQVGYGAGIIAIIAFVIARQESANLVMKIIGPDGIQPPAPFGLGLHKRVQVAMVLCYQQHATAGHGTMHGRRKLRQEVAGAFIGQRVGGIEAKAIKMVLANPV